MSVTTAALSALRKPLIDLVAKSGLPAMFESRRYVEDGGLMGYGGSLAEAFRGTGVYSGRILKGDKPGDLPVQQVTKLELYINLKTAKALGLDFPLPLIGRANEVIE